MTYLRDEEAWMSVILWLKLRHGVSRSFVSQEAFEQLVVETARRELVLIPVLFWKYHHLIRRNASQ